RRRRVGDNRHLLERGFAFRKGLHQGNPLGTQRQAIAGIFDVTAGVDLAAFRLERRSDGEAGIAALGELAGAPGGLIQAALSGRKGHVRLAWKASAGVSSFTNWPPIGSIRNRSARSASDPRTGIATR